MLSWAKFVSPPGCFSQQDCWLFPPMGNFVGKAPSIGRRSSIYFNRKAPRNLPSEATSPPPCHATCRSLLHWWVPTALLPLPLGKQRGKEGLSSAPAAPKRPWNSLWKRLFVHWRDLLIQPSSWHILLSAKTEVGAQCLGRAWFEQVPPGQTPQQGLPVSWPVLLPPQTAGISWDSAIPNALTPLGP